MADGGADVGLIGLAVMGQNLALNMADHGFRVAVFNRTTAKMDEFVEGPAAGKDVVGARSIEELVAALATPRRVMLMVQAGEPVDAVIRQLLPHLEDGDVVIDGGNSHFEDTIRRTADLEARGLRFVGAGVSGGEEGARTGPSIMPGGSDGAWLVVQELLQSIAAEADGDPCCDWIGADGSGHFVKMVHNGIEYGDMQVIAEAYHIMAAGLGMAPAEMAPVFAEWDEGRLDSYLVEITAAIMAETDGGGRPMLDVILDAASQKGTGKWTVDASLDLGIPVTLMAEAVYARLLSALVDQRRTAAEALGEPDHTIGDPLDEVLADLQDALYASKIVSYTQGFMLFRAAAEEHGWDLDLGSIAAMWRAGCIIRSAFLGDITQAFRRDPGLGSLLLDDYFRDEVAVAEPGWRRTVQRAVAAAIPVPAYASALAFYDGYRTARLPANLIQAQRDYFGAHTFERVDAPRGDSFHHDWAGDGGGAG